MLHQLKRPAMQQDQHNTVGPFETCGDVIEGSQKFETMRRGVVCEYLPRNCQFWSVLVVTSLWECGPAKEWRMKTPSGRTMCP
jgi:hypothetical protein